MSDSNDSSSNLIQITAGSIDNAIKNITDAPTKSIGQTFSDLWYLIFGGISHIAEKKKMDYAIKLEKFKAELTASIESVPEEYKQEPDSHTVLLALNDAKFCVEESVLRNMFLNLLTSTVDSRKKAHPSFSQIILSMSRTDAIILKQFQKDSVIPICDYIFTESTDFAASYHTYLSNVILYKPDDIGLDEAACSLDSLMRLGLIESPADVICTDQSVYEEFKTTDIYKQMPSIQPDKSVDILQRVAILTNLGKSFIECCL